MQRQKTSRIKMTAIVPEIDTVDEEKRLKQLRIAKQKQYDERTAICTKELA
jgi:hypothetical protein